MDKAAERSVERHQEELAREELNRRAGEAETVRRDAAMSIDETAQQIRDNLTKLVAQRDELLAALKAIMVENMATLSISEKIVVWRQARAAISRAEGSE